MEFDTINPMLVAIGQVLSNWRLTVVAQQSRSDVVEVRSFSDGSAWEHTLPEVDEIKAFFRKFNYTELRVHQVEDDDNIEIIDVEEMTKTVEAEAEALSDTPLDEDEAVALELVESCATTPDDIRDTNTLDPRSSTRTPGKGAHKASEGVEAGPKTPSRRSLPQTVQKISSQTPARSVLLTPTPASTLADTDAEDEHLDDEEAVNDDAGDAEAMGDDSDDEATVVESELENPFLDHAPSPFLDKEAPTVETENLDELVTTPYLDQFGLAFNRKYKLIICQPCGAGLPLISTHRHLKTMDCRRMMWQEHRGGWNSTLVVLPHPPSTSRVPSRPAFIKKITQSLQEADLIDDQSEIMNATTSAEWHSKLPELDSPPAVVGLRVFGDAYQCHICDKFYLTWNSVSQHYSTTPEHSSPGDAIGSKVIQTLTENSTFVLYFEVRDLPQVSSDSVLPNTPETLGFERDELLHTQGLLEAKQQFVMPLVESTPASDLRQVLPVYHELRIHKFIAQFSDIRSSLWEPYKRKPKDLVYQRLRKIVVSLFKATVDRIDALHNSIRIHITNCTPVVQQRFQRRAFAALTQPKSVAGYAALEFKFIWTILQASRLSSQERPIFTFDTQQLRALQILWTVINDAEIETEKVTSALSFVFRTIYYPQCPNTGLDTFNSPVIVFLLLMTLEDDGKYRSIFLIPPVIAKMQYAMRLHSTPLFHKWFTKYAHVSAERKVRGFCGSHLQDSNIAPFATVREWMHRFSRTSKAMPRAVSVWWRGNVVEVGEVQIDFVKYKAFLHRVLDDLEQHVVQKVLFGVYALADLESLYNISNLNELSPEDDVVGNGILLDVRNGMLQNPASTAFFLSLQEKHLLGISVSKQGSVQFGLKESLPWLNDIDKAVSLLMPLCHVLDGPPGRLTEEAALRATNTKSTTRAVVFERQAGTGGFRSGYHKGAHITGDHKDILRLLPYRVWVLLYVLIRIVRPLELLVLSDFCVPEHKRQQTFDAYSQCIFTSMGKGWEERRMSVALERFFKMGLDVKMGVRLFRHFAVAVQRHFPKTNYGIYDTEPDERRLALIADLMAGHTTKVAEQHYARESSVVLGRISKSDYIRVCQDWHALHGLSTRKAEVAASAEAN